jgi:hypothetical protein
LSVEATEVFTLSPPTANRIDCEKPAAREFFGRTSPGIGVYRALYAEARANVPFPLVLIIVDVLAFVPCGLARPFSKSIHGLQRSHNVEAQSM